MEVVTLIAGERSLEGHQCSVLWRESGHVTVVVSLKEREWSCYGGCHFNGGRSSEVRGGQFNGGFMLWRWLV